MFNLGVVAGILVSVCARCMQLLNAKLKRLIWSVDPTASTYKSHPQLACQLHCLVDGLSLQLFLSIDLLQKIMFS